MDKDASAEHNEIGGTYLSDVPLDSERKQIILAELGKILASRPFRNSSRSKQFLSYVVRNSLDGHVESLKERTIGTEVFQRDPGYATGDDSVVRVNAVEVRRRLEQYHHTAPIDIPVRIEMPLGSYIPEFHWASSTAVDQLSPAPETPVGSEPRPAGLERPAEPQITAVPPVSELPESAPEIVRPSVQIRLMRTWLIVAVLINILFAIGGIAFWIQSRTGHHSVHAWLHEPSVASFWSKFLDASPDTDVILDDSSFMLIQGISKRSFSFNDYLSRSYIDQLQSQNLSPDMQAALSMIASKNLSSMGNIRLAQRILAIDPSGKNIHLYHAREYTPALIKQDNVILLGSQISNPWDELFEGRLNFTVQSNGNPYNVVTNRAPAPGEQKSYTDTGSVGYCVVAYVLNPEHNGGVLLIEGTRSESTEAAGDFLLSEDQLSNFKKILHVTNLPYFEVLLKTTQVSQTPLTETIVAYRTYPNQR